jgi:hypothetical protein
MRICCLLYRDISLFENISSDLNEELLELSFRWRSCGRRNDMFFVKCERYLDTRCPSVIDNDDDDDNAAFKYFKERERERVILYVA